MVVQKYFEETAGWKQGVISHKEKTTRDFILLREFGQNNIRGTCKLRRENT